MIPIHPQACPGRPDALRWVVPAGVLPFTGTAAAVPPALAALLDDGTLSEISLESSAVRTVLSAGGDWGRDGPRVRTALHAALGDPDRWIPAASGGRDDESLRSAAQQLLAGELSRFAASHGGTIELVGVQDGVVTVRLEGACQGCPAAGHTLSRRLEDHLRRRCPDLRAVVSDADTMTGPARAASQRPVLLPVRRWRRREADSRNTR